MRVAEAELAIEQLARLIVIVVLRIGGPINLGNRIINQPILAREQSDRYVQSLEHGHDARGPAIGADVIEALHNVATRLALFGRKGILFGLRDEQPAVNVEIEIHRLANLGLGGHELNREARRQAEFLLLLGGRNGLGRRDQLWRIGKLVIGRRAIDPQLRAR